MDLSLREFNKIIVLGRDMKEIIQKKLNEKYPEVIVITNWADIDEIIPVDDNRNIFLETNNIIKKTMIQFSGNMGLTHDLRSILVSSYNTGHRYDIQYVIAGFGGQRENIKKELSASKAENVLFLNRQPREFLGAMLSSASAIVIPFNPHMRGLSVPSRMYNVMAAGTPIIAMAEADTELALMVSENDAGWVIEPLNSDALTKLILYIATPEGKRESSRRGANGRHAVCADYTFDKVLQRFRSVLSSDL
jgi:glycosyltransferase involved in cell wall biosynthesis